MVNIRQRNDPKVIEYLDYYQVQKTEASIMTHLKLLTFAMKMIVWMVRLSYGIDSSFNEI